MLDLSQIKSITKGAARITEENGAYNFYRFTEEQEDIYKNQSDDFYKKIFATAGVKFLFVTDSKKVTFKGKVLSGSSRRYYSMDILADGRYVDSIDNFDEEKLTGDYTKTDLLFGEFSKTINLGEGKKEVCIYFPWSMKTILEEVILDDNSMLEPVKTNKKLLAFGDSITQGYDALRPFNRYISRVAESLSAEEINKAIGGEVFRQELAKTKEDFVPDYITVAYGTNDWNTRKKEDFEKSCREFYVSLSENYPTAKIFAISPIWRKNYTEERSLGDFSNVEKCIKSVADSLDNVTFIRGFEFVPHDEKYFADLILHPNDKGFNCYFESINKELNK